MSIELHAILAAGLTFVMTEIQKRSVRPADPVRDRKVRAIAAWFAAATGAASTFASAITDPSAEPERLAGLLVSFLVVAFSGFGGSQALHRSFSGAKN